MTDRLTNEQIAAIRDEAVNSMHMRQHLNLPGFMSCNPDTIRALATELLERRAAEAACGLDPDATSLGARLNEAALTIREQADALAAKDAALKTVLGRESATQARHDAAMAAKDAEIERLTNKCALLEESEQDASEARDEGYREGQADATGAFSEFWGMMLRHLSKCGIEPASDDGEGHNAYQMMDAIYEREAEIKATAEAHRDEAIAKVARLREENAALLRANARGVSPAFQAVDDFHEQVKELGRDLAELDKP
jgi:hypothetical protein